MDRYRKMSAARAEKNKAALDEESIQLKKRINRNRKRARFVGILYLLATIALTVLAFVPLINFEGLEQSEVHLGITEFYKAFLDMNLKTVAGVTEVICSGIYVLLLLVLVINLFRTFGKLKWLNKKNANKTYGFNRPVYAMQDMGALFSGSFAILVIAYFLICMLCGVSIAFTEEYFRFLIVVGVASVVRLWTGFLGAKTGYYDIEGKEVIEQKREIGRFVPVFRNLLQLVATFAILFFTLKVNEAESMVTPLLTNTIDEFMQDMMWFITIILQILAALCSFVLIKHATAATEYNIDGVDGAGMKNYRVFSFFVFLFALVAALIEKAMLEKEELNINLLIVAGIAFAMFIVELILRNRPKAYVEKTSARADDGEINVNALSGEYTERRGVEYEEEVEPIKGKAKTKEREPERFDRSPIVMLPPIMSPMQTMYMQQPMYGAGQMYPFLPAQPQQPQMQPQAQPQQQTQPQIQFVPYPISYPQQQAVAPVREEGEEKEEQVEVNQEPLRVEVDCPTCGKRLIINHAVTYHRCPSCQKIFTAETIERYAKPEV